MLDALVLPSFGYPPHMHLTLPVSLVSMRVCTVCGYQRPECGMSHPPPPSGKRGSRCGFSLYG